MRFTAVLAAIAACGSNEVFGASISARQTNTNSSRLVTLGAPAPGDVSLHLPNGKTWGLKDAYDGMFKIAISTIDNRQLKRNPSTEAIINENAHAILTESDLLWPELETSEGEWFWDDLDEWLDYAEENGLEPIGHCLIWKGIGWMSYYPPGISENDLRLLYLGRMERFMKEVLGRYKNRIKRWVVVNEWFDNSAKIRQDWVFIRALGMDGVEAAYYFAQQYGGKNNKFYHSENTLTVNSKYTGVIRNLNALRRKGYQIDGIFMQGHQWHNEGRGQDVLGPFTHAAIADFDSAIKAFGRSNYDVVLSELDITVLPDGWSCCRNMTMADLSASGAYTNTELQLIDPFKNGMDADVAQQQRDKWSRMFQMLIDNSDIVTDVHFWGVADEYSWYNKWPIRGRTDYPTLFTREHKAKPQYWDILRMGPNSPPGSVRIPNPPTELR